MDFQVNNQTYFVTLGENLDDWQVFVSTPEGAMSIPVYQDAAELGDASVLVEDNKRRKIVN